MRNRAGEEARRDIELTVNSKKENPIVKSLFIIIKMDYVFRFFFYYFNCLGPPVIEPFAFPKNLQDGGRAQVTCAVSSGDLPIVFSWKKDDHQISPSLQVNAYMLLSCFIFNNNKKLQKKPANFGI